VGGRSTTVNVYEDPLQPVELGASIFVEVNSILTSSARRFGLETNGQDDRPEVLGVWDGETFRFIEDSTSYEWWNNAKIIWKYGLAPIRTMRLAKDVVGKFLKMYEEPYFPFRSLSETAFELGLATITAQTGDVFLAANSIGPPFSTDIIQASTRVNYAQNLGEIHGLEALVCMSTDGAMAVRGGNWQIFDGMLKSAGAYVRLNTSVTELSKQSDGSYLVSSKQAGQGEAEDLTTEEYDSVVIAAPFQFSGITISPALPHLPDKIPYV
jgi:prenylcysteine oxidase/farnesylcysteine lyase